MKRIKKQFVCLIVCAIVMSTMSGCLRVKRTEDLSDYLHTKFSYYKREWKKYQKELLEILDEEEEICKRLLVLTEREPSIGYEASNHYFYNDRNILEKLLQVDELKEELRKKI